MYLSEKYGSQNPCCIMWQSLILKNDSDCADAVQETLLKAYEKLHTLKQDQFFRTWITRILINECNGGAAKKGKCVISYEEYMEKCRYGRNKKYTHLYMAILNLPEELRILVTLYYIEGFSQKEIVEILHTQEGTIKSSTFHGQELF